MLLGEKFQNPIPLYRTAPPSAAAGSGGGGDASHRESRGTRDCCSGGLRIGIVWKFRQTKNRDRAGGKRARTAFASLDASGNGEPDSPDGEDHLMPPLHELFLDLNLPLVLLPLSADESERNRL
ncbi:hypothetical protein SLEP1_g21120 [Rubroshorea leprosula]|uniref:Uncharacterized protein n=1 Tax=Rubroshorea leprosula TaxID=152421 RepID=A0AAV5J4W8_9ROSI|nr:hypothetical protein SLEP1_g21120 [Rubroshorea leprosula]